MRRSAQNANLPAFFINAPVPPPRRPMATLAVPVSHQEAASPSTVLTEMRSGSEAGPYLRLIDSYITQLKAHGPSRTCNESEEEEEEVSPSTFPSAAGPWPRWRCQCPTKRPNRRFPPPYLRILVYLVIYDSGWVTLEHFLLA